MKKENRLPAPSGQKGARGGVVRPSGRYAETEEQRLKSSANSFSYPGKHRKGDHGPSTADEVPTSELKDFSGQIR